MSEVARNRIRSALLAIALVLLGIALGFGWGRFTRPAPEHRESASPERDPLATTGVGIRSSVDSSQKLLGEPVRLDVVFYNLSSEPVDAFVALDARFGQLSILISRDGAEYRPYQGPYGLTEAHFEPTRVLPGETHSSSEVVYFAPSERVLATDPVEDDTRRLPLAFPEPGRYAIRVRYLMAKDRWLLSDPVELTVKAPSGDDAAAWSELARSDVIRFLHTGTPQESERTVAIARSVLDRYPACRWAPRIREVLASWDRAAESRPRLPTESETQSIEDACRARIDAWKAAWEERDWERFVNSTSHRGALWAEWMGGDDRRGETSRLLDTKRAELGSFSTLRIVESEIAAYRARFRVALESPSGERLTHIELRQDADREWRIWKSGI
jgi:hypothetical protein